MHFVSFSGKSCTCVKSCDMSGEGLRCGSSAALMFSWRVEGWTVDVLVVGDGDTHCMGMNMKV
jgi:hypothetical protein